MFSLLQIIGGIILSIGWIPQIVQIIKTKSVKDLNLKTNVMILIGVSLMEVYAINLFLNDVGLAFLITNTLSLIIAFTVVTLLIIYGKMEGNK